MKLNELRIGNYIDYERTTHVVTGIKNNIIWSRWIKQSDDEDDYFDDEDNHQPIPLTPEILEKAGFGVPVDLSLNSTASTLSKIIGEFNISCLFDFDGAIQVEIGDNAGSIAVIINFVHQFQNIVYYLTGEELNINL